MHMQGEHTICIIYCIKVRLHQNVFSCKQSCLKLTNCLLNCCNYTKSISNIMCLVQVMQKVDFRFQVIATLDNSAYPMFTLLQSLFLEFWLLTLRTTLTLIRSRHSIYTNFEESTFTKLLFILTL